MINGNSRFIVFFHTCLIEGCHQNASVNHEAVGIQGRMRIITAGKPMIKPLRARHMNYFITVFFEQFAELFQVVKYFGAGFIRTADDNLLRADELKVIDVPQDIVGLLIHNQQAISTQPGFQFGIQIRHIPVIV